MRSFPPPVSKSLPYKSVSQTTSRPDGVKGSDELLFKPKLCAKGVKQPGGTYKLHAVSIKIVEIVQSSNMGILY